jgi:hypothetical protein
MLNNIMFIKDNEQLLAIHIPSNMAWSDGLKFFSKNDDFLQVGTWNYEKGVTLKPHSHNNVIREINITQEVLYVKSGSICANIFNTKKILISSIIINTDDILILLSGGHGYEILESSTKVLEIKNGPYLGADLDRTRF